ncbi:MAG: hypothetical protein JXB62_11510 [Pirellulales bacterium]|nr:hypothetical protein [Pirellulales bacterium]
MNPSTCWRVVSMLFVLLVLVAPTLAYNPPVDTAGPLSVRIEGPEVVREIDALLPVRVVLENSGAEPIRGSVEIQLVDRWRVEPSEAVSFSVDGKGRSVQRFKVLAGKGTYSAHYPIHAVVRFTVDGKPYTAHPILILQTELPQPPRAAVPVEWKPLTVPANAELAIWRMPVRRAVVRVFDQPPLSMPVGWQGAEPRSKASLAVRSETLAGEAREVIGVHPPWFEGRVGTMLVEFPLQLPETTPIRLRFAHAVTPTGQGDGVTFRVRVAPLDAAEGDLGRVAFERHSAAKTWQDAVADLSPFAGQAVRLQLESHPGPRNDTGWDQSYWAEPTLIVGSPPPPAPFPPGPEAVAQRLGTIERAAQRYQVLLWPGRRGLLDAVIGFSQGEKRLCFRGFEVRVLGGRIDDARSPIVLLETVDEPCEHGRQVRHRFQSPLGTFDLVGRLGVERGTLQASFHLENTPPPRPWSVVYLEDVAAGPWSETVRQVYAGHGNVVRDPQSYQLSFDGHRLATSFVGFDFAETFSLVQASSVPPSRLDFRPAERHYTLHVPHASTLTFIPAENAFEAAKTWREVNGLAAGGGVRKLAGRFVFDLWGGRYRESDEALQRAFRYGLTDAAVVWHNWQRWGYDYRLPDIYPANPQWGTHDELQRLIETCKQAGVLFALHDNYIDFYPDAEGFSYEKQIAFHREGTPVEAWLNEGRGARSYRYRADAVEPFLRRNLERIRKGLAPDAYFIDVWTSICPYDYWTADGQFFTRQFTNESWGRHFAWIRDLLGGHAPQISESGHDGLIGYVDGAQTNHLRVGNPVSGGRNSWCVLDWRCADAERTPWFDVAHRDRFILHGAGYPSRYPGGLDPRLHGIYSDDYMATEVLTGHPAMVPRAFDRDVVRKYWLLSELMRALALRRIQQVEFVGDDLHRQHVVYDGGGEVWVNRGLSDWDVAGVTLPPYGFLARAPGEKGPVEAAIVRRDGLVVETARSAETLYFNGRRVVDRRLPIRAAVEKIRLGEGRRFDVDLTWQLGVPVPADYRPFLHFVDAEGEILFQAHQQPAPLSAAQTGKLSTTAGGFVPEDLPVAESCELCVGFYRPSDGNRLSLTGADDGTRRIRLGSVCFEGDGSTLRDVSWTPHRPEPDPWLARQNPDGKPIDFGPAVTAGGCRLTREGAALVVTPLPTDRGPKLTVRLRPGALPWRLPGLKHIEAMGEDGRASDRRPVNGAGDLLVIECEPGVFAYRLSP